MIVLGAVAVSVWPQKREVESSAQVTLERQTPTDERLKTHIAMMHEHIYDIALLMHLCIS